VGGNAMRKLRLSVCKRFHKCTTSDGEWDRTWDESYEYIIYDEERLEVDGMDGYNTEEEARKAGEERLKRLEDKG
jgi:hypothetical protein